MGARLVQKIAFANAEILPAARDYLNMATDHTQHLDAEVCRAKAAECRDIAQRAKTASDRIMLLHMAETWERIAKTYEGDN
jgi:hypothetical protein